MSISEPDAVFGIRASRAEPPGRAQEGERRAVYGAALVQFEELLAASRQATPQTRPLSLFYALSQAGRAIAAAHCPEHWQFRGHGLSAPDLNALNLLDVLVQPTPSKRKCRPDSFTSVATATGSEVPTQSISVGALWTSLPGLGKLPPESRLASPLAVMPDEPDIGPLHDWERLSATVAELDTDSPGEAERLLSAYPRGCSARLVQPQGLPLVSQFTAYGTGVRVWWPASSPDLKGHHQTLEEIAPLDLYTDVRWLRPALPDGSSPSILMTWWVLLFALSMVARYEPAGWANALNYDASLLAAPLEELLKVGVELIPELVLEALYGDEV